MSDSSKTNSAWLIALCGPSVGTIELKPSTPGLTLGRQEQCDVRLPAETVSRSHARLRFDAGRWRIADLNSRWGTFLNGCRLPGNAEMLLSEGDLVRITPWTFSFTMAPGSRRGVTSLDDVDRMHTMVRSVTAPSAGAMADDLFALLLESAAGLHAAENEQELAEVMLDAACRGTALPNAAVLRPLDDKGRVEVLASRRSSAPGEPMYSRALLAAASNGAVAELSPFNPSVTSESIVLMKIDAAICVPLMLGSAVAAYLYLDSRGGGLAASRIRPSASAFCVGLGRIAGLALANLKRIDIERRQAMIDAELAAAAEAQRWILPRREAQLGVFEYIGQSRSGRAVGGDFFDIIPLDDTRIAVALGDVSGKGIAASVLMTAAQGFLHAALREHGQPDRAVAELNRFVLPRRPSGKFITLWVAVFDAKAGTLRYVDAGHGYAVMLNADGRMDPLVGREGLPVGLSAEGQYDCETVPLQPGGRVLVVSDGIVEQPAADTDSRQIFGLPRVYESLSRSSADQDAVAALFQTVTEFAGTPELADDATAVLVRWRGKA